MAVLMLFPNELFSLRKRVRHGLLILFPQELVEQMLLRLDLAVAASPKLRPAVRQLVPALLGPQVNNLKMFFFNMIIVVFTCIKISNIFFKS